MKYPIAIPAYICFHPVTVWNLVKLQVAEVPCDQPLYAVWDMEELQCDADELVQNWPISVWLENMEILF